MPADQAEPRVHGAPRSQRIVGVTLSRVATFWACLGAFAALTVALIVNPVLGDLDAAIADTHPKANHPELVVWVRDYELLGQRGPTLIVVIPLVVWFAWRRRRWTPVIALVTAELLLNVSVGALKYGFGRIGPFYSGDAHRFFAGGTIYPSGHVSNAVVLYGLLASMVPQRWRRRAAAAAVFLSVTVGVGTVFLRTHWLSDVVGGWLVGGLILLALPTVLPTAQRMTDVLVRTVTGRRAGRATPRAHPPTPSTSDR